MCQTCYDRGYNDYPKWVGSTQHPDSYRNGWDKRKSETGGSSNYAPSTDFCQKCYDRGCYDAGKGTWAPPDTHGGHFESYKKGYSNGK